jgi:glycosyltransferase involved in cell wall biosynthesis
MRIVAAHNFYQRPGGEDEVFAAERELLEERGHEVDTITAHNDRIRDMGRATLAATTLWSRAGYREVRTMLRQRRPDVLHVHNTFPLLSPSIYHAARAEGVPVVQTLHNYRLLCPAATLYRAGKVCTDCLGRAVPWPAAQHGCYQGSRARSSGVVAMLTLHRALGTWTRTVARYVVMTEFGKAIFTKGGLPADRLVVKPHFLPTDPGPGAGAGGFVLFVGRLTSEKGVETLCAAWDRLAGVPLKVVGDGPLAHVVQAAAMRNAGVEWLGQRSRDDVLALMGDAAIVVFPSQWYETFGLVIIESFARGVPVVAANVGGAPELIDDGRTGVLFRSGDAADLARRVSELIAAPAAQRDMRAEARREYESKYTPDRNYERLVGIYHDAIATRARPAH